MTISLEPPHFHDLRKSGLNDSTIELMKLRSLRPADIDKLCPGGLPGVDSVLEFPYDKDFSRYKLFPPLQRSGGKDQKYLQAPGTGCRLYIVDLIRPILSDPTVPLFFFEGEKKTGLAIQHRKMAVGVSGVWNWVEGGTGNGIADLDQIAWPDRKVEVAFDSDVWMRPDLQRALYAFMRELSGRGADVTAVVIPGKGDEKVGFDDFVVANNIEAFEKLTRVNLRHAALSRHKDWWEKWREKKSKHTKEVTKLAAQLRNIEPWPDPVDGAVLLHEIRAAIARFIVVPPEALVAIALWVLLAHSFDAFSILAMLVFSSPVRQCGKSLTQAIVSKFVPKPLTTSNISPAALFRVIEKFSPTLIVDECDSAFNANPELRELVNASHLRSQAFVCRTVGDNHEPSLFCTWGPKCLALIGALPDTTASRSIVIRMQRKTRTDKIEKFSAVKSYPEFEILQRKAARWAADNIAALREAEPAVVGDTNDRDQDNWLPLFAIADSAGGEWPKLARDAAKKLSGEPDDESKAVELLKDLHMMFAGDPESESDAGCELISSADLVGKLNEKDGRPWADYNRGNGVTSNQVARMLKGFGIYPRVIRIGNKTPRGYRADQFDETFLRYLPPTNRNTRNTGNENSNLCETYEPQQNENVAVKKSDVSSRPLNNVEPVAAENHPKEGTETDSGPPDSADAGGFDWTNGIQRGAVEYWDGDGKLQRMNSVNEAWAKIKEEREAKKRRLANDHR